MTKKALAACLLLIPAFMMLAMCTRPPSAEEGAQLGYKAPIFKLPDLNGREVSLDQYKGKIVMLEFWASWCGPCRLTMPLLEGLHKEYANDMALLAINLQEPSDVAREYVRRHSISSTVLLDQDGDVGQAYGSDSIPMLVLIDKKGIVRNVQIGYSPSMGDKLRTEINKLR